MYMYDVRYIYIYIKPHKTAEKLICKTPLTHYVTHSRIYKTRYPQRL